MKAKLLVGLLTVALGGLTSCSNILEENGTINNVAESGMGELRINLSTNDLVDVSTKSIDYSTLLDDFDVTMSKPSSMTENPTLPNGKYIEIKEKTYTLPAANGYTLLASYGKEMTEKFVWDKPFFKGESPVDIKSKPDNTANIQCTLQNAILSVDVTNLTNNNVTIKSLKAYDGEDRSTAFTIMNNGNSIGTTLYVKSGVTPKLVLEGTLTIDGKSVSFTTPAKGIETSVSANNKYSVSYSLSEKNGQLTIAIQIDNVTENETIMIPVDPYTPANQSSGGGE